MNEPRTADKHSHNPVVRYFRALGPGLITGAADDDPSGVTTYAVAGATFGTGMLWTALVTLPLMAAIQLTCARIGLVSGRGLAGAMRHHYPRWFLYAACLLLLVANIFNIAADLAGMADAAEMLTGLTAAVARRRVRLDARRDPRHDDLAVPLLLAGLAGGRGGARPRAPHGARAPRRHRSRAA